MRVTWCKEFSAKWKDFVIQGPCTNMKTALFYRTTYVIAFLVKYLSEDVHQLA